MGVDARKRLRKKSAVAASLLKTGAKPALDVLARKVYGVGRMREGGRVKNKCRRLLSYTSAKVSSRQALLLPEELEGDQHHSLTQI